MAYLPRKVKRGDAITAAAWNATQDEIKRLGNVSVSGGLVMSNGPGGLALGLVISDATPITAVVATGGIAARVNSTTLGEGNAVLWPRTPGSATIAAGETVKVYNSFNVAPPSGTFVEVLPDGEAYKLVASDCF